jgi:DNA-binding NtrC family response regulator
VCWRRGAAALRLRISYKTLLEKIKQYGLDRPGG